MSLVRAFTTRKKRVDSVQEEQEAMPSLLQKSVSKVVERPKISSPILLSTTNVHTYNAPDVATAHKLRKVSSISSASSRSSDKDSDVSSTSARSRGASVTDASSVGSSPPSPSASPLYFQAKKNPVQPRRAASSAELRGQNRSEETPAIPQRAPSHSKTAHEQLARKRSLQTINMPPKPEPAGRPSPVYREQRTSLDMFNHREYSHPRESSSHPFGKELEQLDEIVEEFGGAFRDAERDADLEIMKSRGLQKFSANDYIMEIEPLFTLCFHGPPQNAKWI